MAENIIGISTGDATYKFRPLYSVESSDSLGADYSFELDNFDAVDEATFLLYFTANDLLECNEVITFQTTTDGDRWWRVFYGGRELTWQDLVPCNFYEFSCHVDSDGFHLTGNIPKTSIKYRDSRNQLQTLTIGENANIDLTGGVYYATTSATATRVANSLKLTDVNGDVQEYNGASPIDLSAGVNYAALAGHADDADSAEGAIYAFGLKEYGYPIPGQHIAGEYCHIATVGMYEYASANYSILFTGYGFNSLLNAPWSGILYFEWNAQSFDNLSASAKWVCLTRPELSDKILLTVSSASSSEKILHIWFAYPNTYASADVTLIKGSDVSFDIDVRTGLIGTTIATSTFDSGSSAGNLNYQILDDSGSSVHSDSVDLENETFIFRPGPNITISSAPTSNSNTNGVFIKLSEEFTQAFVQLQQYVQILQYTVANQKQQITDLKSVLTEITTGKTWDSNIWGENSGQGETVPITTDENENIDIQPLS